MKSSINKWLLKQCLVKVLLVLITFFSLNISVNASSFAYNSFDWNTFYEENKNYWSDYCESSTIDENDCIEVVLTGKKGFYERLYKLLAKYEYEGYKLDDNIIIATAFFDLTPDTFTGNLEEYRKEYQDGSAYNIDEDEDIENYNINTDESADYYENETDSLKTLIKHMLVYPASCEGPVASPETDGSGNKVCYQGTLENDKCVGEIKPFNLTYSEHLLSKWKDVASLLGMKSNKNSECVSLGGELKSTGEKEINYDAYWEFLIESDYFDNKVHLTHRYEKVLNATNHDLMKELNSDEKEKYKDDIKKIRENIVEEIQSILKDYGEQAQTPDSFFTAGSTNNLAWWPIGSNETTTEGGLLFAKGDPASLTVTSVFGQRIHPITKKVSHHSGIDIGGVTEGVTNIIAVKDGVVVYPTAGANVNCPSSASMDSCGGGYGNYVVIQHNDGTYSLYAHMYAGSITVKANDSVKQGQLIGKAGSSGNSTGPHLHFEIRNGSNSSASSVDPLNYISKENPRPLSSGEFTKMLHWFEGSCASPTKGNNYLVHDDGYGYLTVGYGVALPHNVENFKKYNVDVSNMAVGDEISISIVNEIENIKINQFRTYVQNYLAKNSITLTEYQVDCLVMISYQFGDIGNFATVYKEHGNTNELKNNAKDAEGSYYFSWNPSTANGRAEATWKLFHEGIYTYNESCN